MAAITLRSTVLGYILLGILFCSPAWARTSLVALPLRQDTAIKLDSRGSALVQEKRTLTLKKGLNNIDFSWQNVMIDPDSIQFVPLQHADEISILSVSYPPGESALVWKIYSPGDFEEKVVISYLLANIDGIMAYQAITGLDEKTMLLKSFMVLRNFSGENFDSAAVSINSGKPFSTAIDHLETKKIRIWQQPDIPITKIYTWDAEKMPHDPRHARTAPGIPAAYELSNTSGSKLGQRPLLEGKVRIFQDDGKQSTIFLGEDICGFTPVGDKARLHIGDSRDIVVIRRVMDSNRSNIKRNKKGKIQVYDESRTVNVIAQNLKDKPVTLSVLETINGHWQPVSISMEYERLDHKTLKFKIPLLPNQKKTLTLQYKILNIFSGSYARFNRVRQ